jgi:hypothetical protein
MTDEEAYHELSAYTMSHTGTTFIHQHVVDAWGAQHATPDGKPVRLFFSLAGLYLHLERGFTGRQVQKAHADLAARSKAWPLFPLPADRGSVTAGDVMHEAAGPERDRMIEQWGRSVWAAFSGNRDAVIALLRQHRIVD